MREVKREKTNTEIAFDSNSNTLTLNGGAIEKNRQKVVKYIRGYIQINLWHTEQI